MRWTITRLFDTSLAKASTFGKENPDIVSFLAEAFPLIRNIFTKGISYADNVNCQTKDVTLKHSIPQVISVPNGKTVTGMHILGARLEVGTALVVTTGFGWQYDQNGNFKVTVLFDSIPATANVVVSAVLLF